MVCIYMYLYMNVCILVFFSSFIVFLTVSDVLICLVIYSVFFIAFFLRTFVFIKCYVLCSFCFFVFFGDSKNNVSGCRFVVGLIWCHLLLFTLCTTVLWYVRLFLSVFCFELTAHTGYLLVMRCSYCFIRYFHDFSIDTIVWCQFWVLGWSAGEKESLATHTVSTHCFLWLIDIFRTSDVFFLKRYPYFAGKLSSP